MPVNPKLACVGFNTFKGSNQCVATEGGTLIADIMPNGFLGNQHENRDRSRQQKDRADKDKDRPAQFRKLHLLRFVIALLLLTALFAVCPERASAATPVNCGQTLNSPAEYILTGNLSCTGTALHITSSDVHFSLNGFTIDGDGTGIGIDVGLCVPTTRVHINGGTVTDFDTGILLCASTKARVNGMIVTGNTGIGIELSGSDNNQITGNSITDTGESSFVYLMLIA